MSLDSIADELYGLPPQDFTSTRNDLARAARTAGDNTLAEQIRALRKPTVVAWLANQVARQHPELIESLRALGQQLREAMSAPSGPELRRLGAQQRELRQTLVELASELARTSGHSATDQVVQSLTDTLHAALADPQAAEALASGRLTAALPPPAFGGMPQEAGLPATALRASTEVAAQSAPSAAGQQDEVVAANRERARQAAAEAQAHADRASQTLEQATASLEGARARSLSAAELVEGLRAQLAEAQAERDSAEQAEDAARSARHRAVLAVREAGERLDAALLSMKGSPDG